MTLSILVKLSADCQNPPVERSGWLQVNISLTIVLTTNIQIYQIVWLYGLSNRGLRMRNMGSQEKRLYGCFSALRDAHVRTFLGVGKCAPLPMMYGDMYWIPSHARQQAAMVRYWSRLLKIPPYRLNKQIFEWDYLHARRGTWCYDIKKICEKCDMSEIYEQKCAKHDTVAKVRDTLRHLDSEQRKIDMAAMSRMKVYRDINGGYNHTAPARYLLIPLSRQQRSVLARLRSGTLALAIETGRYGQIPAENRLCKQCESGTVEDELHFLFVYPKHNIRRDELLPNITILNDICSSDISMRRTASFITGSMTERD